MKKPFYLIIFILFMFFFWNCAPNTPAEQYAKILKHVLAEMQYKDKDPKIISENISEYVEKNKEKIVQLQEALLKFNEELIYKKNLILIEPTVLLRNQYMGNQNFRQDKTISSVLKTLKIIE